MKLRHVCAAVVSVLGWGGGAFAQDAWPSQPISIVSGFPGGAATDLYARKLGVELAPVLKTSFITDNRTGAGGNIASAFVAHAKPDGYTLLLGTAGTHAINPALYRKLGFDPMNDFSRIALLGDLPNVLLVNPEKHPDIKTCKDLLAAERKQPGVLNYASTGNGASGHLAAVQFSGASQTTATHVPYRGQGPAMTALMAGDVDFFFNQSSPSIPVIQSGKVRALAITSAQRIAALPDVPTVAEACGLPGFESTTWYGLFGPAGLPPAVQARLSSTVLAAINTEDFKKWLVSQGIAPIQDGSPAAFTRTQQADMLRWAKIVKESGAQVD
ncbi:tripartite tricarboxylate transporter substrate binding protein [Xylophilus sp. Kf1]|nr:tripartite tricarboxylate transporter substrate binding protein [Xylophilus sp. Kf1]